ncbi:MAG: aldose epimerase family protein [Eubacteriales bacterium]|nr:aldose epimerase family protein [Eubacteriales bacterium]
MVCKVLEERANGVCMMEMANDDITVIVSNLGCHINSIFTKDRNGEMGDVLIGYENVEDCHKPEDGSCMGAVVGRVANRIEHGRFTLNGVEYQLNNNIGTNHLHGGNVGFDRKIFDYKWIDNGIQFHYFSPDGEENYPGNLDLTVTYVLEGPAIRLIFEAVTDKDTIINITNHAYFNLSAGQEKIYDHLLRIDADQFAIMNDESIVKGEMGDVEGTPFDFRSPKAIGQDINADHDQLKKGHGYDHAFILSSDEDQVDLYHEPSGRGLIISTSMPTLQVYTSNFLGGGVNGKHGAPYEDRDAVALETQYLPNSINVEEEPKVILRKGDTFKETTVFKFYSK